MADEPLDLDAVYGTVAGQVVIGGVTYDVRRLSCQDVQRLRDVKWDLYADPREAAKRPKEATESFDILVSIAEHLMVGMTPEQVRTLPPPYIGAIVNRAASMIQRVEQSAPKADGAAAA